MRCWCCYLSGASFILFAYGPADATASQKPHQVRYWSLTSLNITQMISDITSSSLASFKSRLVLHFWYRLTQVVLEESPLNRCSVVVVVVLALEMASPGNQYCANCIGTPDCLLLLLRISVFTF